MPAGLSVIAVRSGVGVLWYFRIYVSLLIFFYFFYFIYLFFLWGGCLLCVWGGGGGLNKLGLFLGPFLSILDSF